MVVFLDSQNCWILRLSDSWNCWIIGLSDSQIVGWSGSQTVGKLSDYQNCRTVKFVGNVGLVNLNGNC